MEGVPTSFYSNNLSNIDPIEYCIQCNIRARGAYSCSASLYCDQCHEIWRNYNDGVINFIDPHTCSVCKISYLRPPHLCCSCITRPKGTESCPQSMFCSICHDNHMPIYFTAKLHDWKQGKMELLESGSYCGICRSEMHTTSKCRECSQRLPSEKSTQTEEINFSNHFLEQCEGCIYRYVLKSECPIYK